MSLRITSTSVVGATILAFSAATAFAQASPKSTKRIPIQKEAAGEVVRDTVVRTDTLVVTNTVYRTDTLFRTITRVDSVMIQPPSIPIHLPNGFYLGAAGGSSSPDGSIFTPNGVGYMGQFALGFQRAKQILGGRISTTYTGLGQDSRFSAAQGGRAQLWTLGTDLKVQAPLGHFFGLTPRLNAYGIGGWTYTWFKRLPMRLDSPDNAPNVLVFTNGEDSWTGRNGWDAGGGLSLLWGHNEVFVESRVMGFSPSNAPQARQIPILFGYNMYGWY